MLILIAILASPVNLNIPDGNWLSPDYRMVEEWTLDPFDYGLTQSMPLGCISELFKESEHIWEVILLGENNLYKLSDGKLSGQVSIALSLGDGVRAVFSPGGKYLVLFDSWEGTCIRTNLEEMSSEFINLYDGETPSSTSIRVTDSGSIITRFRNSTGSWLRVFNCQLDLVYEDSGFRQYNERITHSDNDGIIFYTKVDDLIAVDITGHQIWRSNLGVYPEDAGDRIPISEIDDVSGFTTCRSGSLIAVQRVQKLELFDGNTGSNVFRETFDMSIMKPLLSSEGKYLVLATQYPPSDPTSITSGILLFDLTTTPFGRFEATYTATRMQDYVDFVPLAVSDEGLVLARLRSQNWFSGYRVILLSSSLEPIWVSSTSDSETRFFASLYGGLAGISEDSTRIWYFDGEHVHFYRLDAVLFRIS